MWEKVELLEPLREQNGSPNEFVHMPNLSSITKAVIPVGYKKEDDIEEGRMDTNGGSKG